MCERRQQVRQRSTEAEDGQGVAAWRSPQPRTGPAVPAGGKGGLRSAGLYNKALSPKSKGARAVQWVTVVCDTPE